MRCERNRIPNDVKINKYSKKKFAGEKKKCFKEMKNLSTTERLFFQNIEIRALV